MSKFSKVTGVLILIIIIAFLFSVGSFFGFLKVLVNPKTMDFGVQNKPHFGVIRIEGPILASESVLEQIERAQNQQKCQGLLIRLNSPGGAVGASQEIFLALKEYKTDSLKPIVVSMGNTAASGAYYIALAGDKVFANPGTLTGSIGVIASFPEAGKLFDKIGITMNVVKSGGLKDAGSIFRKPTPKEREYLQSVVDESYGQFFSDVAESRHLDDAQLKEVADGRVMTGKRARALGLVDTLGTLLAAKAYLIKSTGSSNETPFIELKPKQTWIDKILSESPMSNSNIHRFSRLLGTRIWFMLPDGISQWVGTRLSPMSY